LILTGAKVFRNRSTTLLLAAVLIVGAGQTVVFAIVPPVSRSIGLTEVQSSLIFTASAAATFLTSPLWGRASDSFGRFPVVLLGLTAYGVLLAILAYILGSGVAGASVSFVFAGLVACRTLHGGLTAGVLPASQAHLADESGPMERVGGMAAVSIAFGLGSLVGPGVVGLLAPFGTLAGLWFFSLAAVSLAAILVVISRRGETRRRTQVVGGKLQFTSALVCCLIVSSGVYTAFLGTMQITGFIAQDRFHYSSAAAVSVASYTFLVIAGSMILTQAVIVKLKSDQPKKLVVVGLLSGIAAYLTALLDIDLPGALLAPVLLGISLAFALPAVSAIASFASAHGAALGAIGATQALGFLVGPLLASYLYSVGHSLPLIVDAAILLSCAFVASGLPRGLPYRSDPVTTPGDAPRSS
jgi:MFS family permease